MYSTDPSGHWPAGGGLAGYAPPAGIEEAVRSSAEAAKQYLRDQWAAFLALGASIIDLQHEAALVAQRARQRGDLAGELAAKDEIAKLGELNQAHSWAVHTYELEGLGQRLGLGAVPAIVPAALFSSLALVVVWAFRAYGASAEKLRMIEAGTLTPEQAAALDPGPSPQMLFTGATDIMKLALAGLGLWIVAELVSAYAPVRRARRNPPLEVWRANPPVFGAGVYDVRYRHADDDHDYVHTFGPDVELAALPDGSVLLSHRDGLPLWDEFES